MKDTKIGEKRMMNCGMMAEIIGYAGYGSVTIKFEDGTILENRTYGNFKKGTIANPFYNEQKRKHVGEKQMMNCGMMAEIIQYDGYGSVTVRFQDGTVVENRNYGHFKNGNIANLSSEERVSRSRKACVGEKRMMHCGLEAEIIHYTGYYDVTVKFEDGTIVKNKTYSNFKKGSIAHPFLSGQPFKHLGEKRMMHCGMEAEIIHYSGCGNITVRFEDGTVVENRIYSHFKTGNIANPTIKKDID